MVTRELTTGHVCQCTVRRGGQAGRQRRGEAHVFNYHTTVLSAVNPIKTVILVAMGKTKHPRNGEAGKHRTQHFHAKPVSFASTIKKELAHYSKVNSIEDNVLKCTEDQEETKTEQLSQGWVTIMCRMSLSFKHVCSSMVMATYYKWFRKTYTQLQQTQ